MIDKINVKKFFDFIDRFAISGDKVAYILGEGWTRQKVYTLRGKAYNVTNEDLEKLYQGYYKALCEDVINVEKYFEKNCIKYPTNLLDR